MSGEAVTAAAILTVIVAMAVGMCARILGWSCSFKPIEQFLGKY